MTSLRPSGAALLLGMALSTLLPATVHAQTAAPQDRSFNPQLFHPAPGPDEFITVEPALPLRHKSYGLGLFFDYAHDEFSIFGYNPTTKKETAARAQLLE